MFLPILAKSMFSLIQNKVNLPQLLPQFIVYSIDNPDNVKPNCRIRTTTISTPRIESLILQFTTLLNQNRAQITLLFK